MTYENQNNVLKINNRELEFENEIKEVLEFDGFLVVRTDYYNSNTNENVYGVNADGKIKWQIEKLTKLTHKGIEYDGISDPYTAIKKLTNEKAQLVNWDSTHFEIDVYSGKLITNPMKSRIGKRPW